MANPTAIGLVRVSTSDQHLGLDAQRADIARFAAGRGIDVLSTVTEIVSGGAPFEDRTGLVAALEAVAVRRATHLIVAKRDRLARDPLVALMAERSLGKCGATVLAADGNNAMDPASEAMRGMLDVFARFERRMVGIRTKAALAALKAGGASLGRPLGAKDKHKRKVYKTRSPRELAR